MFQLIHSNLVIEDNSEFTDSESIVDSYVSSVAISDSKFSRLSSVDNTLKIVGSTLNITNCEFDNITTSDNSELIEVAFDSILNVEGLSLSNSTLPFLELISASADVKRLTLNSVTSENRIIIVDSVYRLVIDGLTMRGVYSINSEPFEIYRSSVNLLKNVDIIDFDQAPLIIKNSQVEIVDSMKLTNCSLPAVVENSLVKVISNSTFEL